LKLTGTHQVVIYAEDVNILDGNTNASVVTTKEFRLEVEADKTKCLIKSRDPNAGQNLNINIDNTSLD
jgi:hypothetical protein